MPSAPPGPDPGRSAGVVRNPLGSILLGSGLDESGRALRVRVQLLLTTSIVLANVIGALVVVTLVVVVIPGPSVFTRGLVVVNFVLTPLYVGLAVVLGSVYGTLRALRALRWSTDGREPTMADQVATLSVPGRLVRVQLALWFVGAALFTVLYGLDNPRNIPRVGFTTVLGGVVVSAIGYRLSEFSLRPVAARALVAGTPRRRRLSGVRGRTVLAWALGSGVPVLGLMLVALFALARPDVSVARLAVTVLALGGVILLFGSMLTVLTANAVVAPIRAVRRGLAGVERGELGTRVVVFDGSELGELQSGFNVMVAGLAEREQLRDLFGKHVGRGVAEKALERTPELGGEEREVAVFFIDLVGSTSLAQQRSPTEVVALLNRFFAVVVDEVERQGGFINKFEGDGALAIFGAPGDHDDAAGAALAAARTISTRLTDELPECSAGTGISAGRAVAGNVGDARRFEYTVIGDPVNQAARLAELSKQVPGGVLASWSAVEAAAAEEAAHWVRSEQVQLRGRTGTTTTAVPAPPSGAPA